MLERLALSLQFVLKAIDRQLQLLLRTGIASPLEFGQHNLLADQLLERFGPQAIEQDLTSVAVPSALLASVSTSAT